MHPREGDLPPLPPSSGTPVGYLIDNAGDLHLRDDQVTKLKEIDTSLSAQQAEIDTQLRAIEKPDKDLEKEEQEEHKRHNNAPGQGITTNSDAGRLHQLHDRNDQDALGRAFAILAPEQQETARKILEERGVHAPGSKLDRPRQVGDDGTPLPGAGEP
jgi:hypothetical protein|nr:hypothetical protein [Kofleriaceae bacterium]